TSSSKNFGLTPMRYMLLLLYHGTQEETVTLSNREPKPKPERRKDCGEFQTEGCVDLRIWESSGRSQDAQGCWLPWDERAAAIEAHSRVRGATPRGSEDYPRARGNRVECGTARESQQGAGRSR